MARNFEKILDTDKFSTFVTKVNAVIDALNATDGYVRLGNKIVGLCDTLTNLKNNEVLMPNDICLTLGSAAVGDESVKIWNTAATLGDFNNSQEHYQIKNGNWVYRIYELKEQEE